MLPPSPPGASPPTTASRTSPTLIPAVTENTRALPLPATDVVRGPRPTIVTLSVSASSDGWVSW